jgi:hypothetical protein
MYANLRVEYGTETLFANRIEQDEDGVLHLDLEEDGEATGETREIVAGSHASLTITADY